MGLDTFYDPGSRVVANVSFQRKEDDTTTVGELDGSNSYRDANVTWYDKADRVTHAATFGRDDDATNHYVWSAMDVIIDADTNGIPDIAEGSPKEPNQSVDWIASKTEYDSAGRGYRTTDNLGRIVQTDFDLLNRAVRSIENYTDGVVTETETDTDQTVEYIYDAQGRMSTLRAKNPKGSGNGVENQDTVYLFESYRKHFFQSKAVDSRTLPQKPPPNCRSSKKCATQNYTRRPRSCVPTLRIFHSMIK